MIKFEDFAAFMSHRLHKNLSYDEVSDIERTFLQDVNGLLGIEKPREGEGLGSDDSNYRKSKDGDATYKNFEFVYGFSLQLG